RIFMIDVVIHYNTMPYDIVKPPSNCWVKEGDRLEYKENLPKANDDERIKFLSTVASLANSLGGDTHAALSPAVPALCREPRPVARAGRVLRRGQPEA
ncbi:MAG: hypothetical protein ACXWO1_13730, partial [Isosphaeraceae bacterium]